MLLTVLAFYEIDSETGVQQGCVLARGLHEIGTLPGSQWFCYAMCLFPDDVFLSAELSKAFSAVHDSCAAF